jgi:hypothetical protein
MLNRWPDSGFPYGPPVATLSIVDQRPILILMLSTGIAGCGVSDAEPDDSATMPATDTPPVLRFDSTQHNFGVIDETSEVATSFEFTNTGGSELVIEEVKASCGCTTPLLSKRRYQPGERGTIEVGFDPTGPGPTQQHLTVLSNTSPAVTRLTITANVTAFLVFKPKILQLGARQYRVEHRARVTVNSPDENFVIESASVNQPYVTVRVLPPEQAPGPKTLEVTVAPTAPWGGLYFGIDVTATGRPTRDAEPVTHLRTIRVAGRLFGRLSANPDLFRFSVFPGNAIDETIRLRRADGRPFRILKTDVSVPRLPGVTVTATPETLDVWLIRLRATAGSSPGTCLGKVVVTTDVRGEETVELRTLGVIRTPG